MIERVIALVSQLTKNARVWCVAVNAMLVLLLSACVNVSVTEPALKPVDQAAIEAALLAKKQAEIRAARAQRLRNVLANAQQAFADDRLMLPAFDNAYYWYQQALAIDELNAEAHWGMRQITDRYLVLAEQAFNSGRIEVAEHMLSGAEKIAAPPAQINALRERYRENTKENQFLLSRSALTARSDTIKQQLAELALAMEPNQRLLIVARNDSEGRWIYLQMRNAVDGFRLRGNIELGRVPRITIIDL